MSRTISDSTMACKNKTERNATQFKGMKLLYLTTDEADNSIGPSEEDFTARKDFQGNFIARTDFKAIQLHLSVFQSNFTGLQGVGF